MSRAPDSPLYLLAADHRRSFERLLGMTESPSDKDVRRIRDAKQLIWEGFQRALEGGVLRDSAGILVDLHYGEEIAREARRLGLTFAIPIERSDQQEFQYEQEHFADAVEEIAPTYVKALVRYNPRGDAGVNARQRRRLLELSTWLSDRPYGFLFELLVPPEPDQLGEVDGDVGLYDARLRPGLMLGAIEELQDAGIEPDVWKIEGLDARADCNAIAKLVRRDGRRAGCVVLGRGASLDRVDDWLRAARGLPGYLGFAVGRSIFTGALDVLASKAGPAARAAAAAQIARNFARFVSVYES